MLGVGQEDLADLRDVGLGVGVDDLAGEHRAKLVSARRIADPRGVIADDDDGLVSPLLKLADDFHRHGVAKRHIRRGRIHAELDAELLSLRELRAQFRVGNDPLGAARELMQLFVDADHEARDCTAWDGHTKSVG